MKTSFIGKALAFCLTALLALPAVAQEDALKGYEGYVDFGELTGIVGETTLAFAAGQTETGTTLVLSHRPDESAIREFTYRLGGLGLLLLVRELRLGFVDSLVWPTAALALGFLVVWHLARDDDVDLAEVARATPGFSGADLANLVNEAALLAARRNKRTIGMRELEEAMERVIAGPERRSRVITPEEKQVVAYHEAGHAIVGYNLKEADEVYKITIVARGQAGERRLAAAGWAPQQERGQAVALEQQARLSCVGSRYVRARAHHQGLDV